ncbi:cation diffusion facilitator family transporter [Alishewanella sp. 16-MA]|uniref:Cation diffusion facilitator family transporter n=1 Tax=Alishewanella maricola TaxID=2795740 RepID=A0ABS8C148_9ALTE|nr:cation diffusion facilitator family transporter [Alishewanella maricola]MCB5226028.1 cation diffusion facilitator family transporter [Alishewanella maricola]
MSNLLPRQLLLLSLLAGFLTMALKTLAWYLTDSVGFLSDAIESLVNVAGASFALMMVTLAKRPADEHHPFGHTKAEYFSAAFEGGMIFLAALAIMFTAVERLLNPQPLLGLNIGIVLTVLASLLNLAVGLLLVKGGQQHQSPALEGDGKHLLTDVWTTAGVVIGVVLAALTGFIWLDALVAILVALHILREGGSILFKAINGLMDRALTAEQIATIEQIFVELGNRQAQFTHLRTRAAATQAFAQADLLVPGDWSVERAHQLADAAEQQLLSLGVQLTVHIEPLDYNSSDNRLLNPTVH